MIELSSIDLATTLLSYGFESGRIKTGIPSRLDVNMESNLVNVLDRIISLKEREC